MCTMSSSAAADFAAAGLHRFALQSSSSLSHLASSSATASQEKNSAQLIRSTLRDYDLMVESLISYRREATGCDLSRKEAQRAEHFLARKSEEIQEFQSELVRMFEHCVLDWLWDDDEESCASRPEDDETPSDEDKATLIGWYGERDECVANLFINGDVTRLRSLANFFREERNDNNRALFLWYRVRNIQEDALGKEHLDVAESCVAIGELYNEMEDYGSALVQFERALAIRETTLGKNKLETALSYIDVGEVLWNLGHKEESLFKHCYALVIVQGALGSDSASYKHLARNVALRTMVMRDSPYASPA